MIIRGCERLKHKSMFSHTSPGFVNRKQRMTVSSCVIFVQSLESIKKGLTRGPSCSRSTCCVCFPLSQGSLRLELVNTTGSTWPVSQEYFRPGCRSSLSFTHHHPSSTMLLFGQETLIYCHNKTPSTHHSLNRLLTH